MTPAKILIVDDERVALRNLEYVMKKEGYQVVSTQSGANAFKLLDEQPFDVVLTDLRMEKVGGMDILQRCRRNFPDIEVIMITGYATLESGVDAMKQGAFHYISKPYKLDEVRKVVKEAVEKVALKRENQELRDQLDQYQGRVKIVTENPSMQRLIATAQQVAAADVNVLLTGESGTGKEQFARFIHNNSKRADRPFQTVQCSAVSEEVLAAQLFGQAGDGRQGLLESASGGTIYFDEVTELPAALQTSVLRAIQDRTIIKPATAEPAPVDIRFIAGTSRNIQAMIKKGTFRQELFYKLNVVSFRMPALTERRDDIPLLAHFFLKRHAAVMKKNVEELSEDVLGLLSNYDFPGNVRELETIIERGVALTNSNRIESAHLPDDLRELNIRTFRKKKGKIPSLDEQEMSYIKWVLNEVGGNKTVAAQILNIDRVSLWRKLKKYGLEEEE